MRNWLSGNPRDSDVPRLSTTCAKNTSWANPTNLRSSEKSVTYSGCTCTVGPHDTNAIMTIRAAQVRPGPASRHSVDSRGMRRWYHWTDPTPGPGGVAPGLGSWCPTLRNSLRRRAGRRLAGQSFGFVPRLRSDIIFLAFSGIRPRGALPATNQPSPWSNHSWNPLAQWPNAWASISST